MNEWQLIIKLLTGDIRPPIGYSYIIPVAHT